MAYYCIVTGVDRPNHTRVRVEYELRDDSPTPHQMIDRGTLGLEMLPIDAMDTTVDPPVQMTAAQRRAHLRSQLQKHFVSLIKRAQGAEADYNAIASQAIGFRVP